MSSVEDVDCGMSIKGNLSRRPPQPSGGIPLHVGDERGGPGPGHEATSEFLPFRSMLMVSFVKSVWLMTSLEKFLFASHLRKPKNTQ